VFLETLPKWECDAYKGKINWILSAGYMVHFIFNGIEGDMEILKFNRKTQYITVKYDDEKFKISQTSFKYCKLRKLFLQNNNKQENKYGNNRKTIKRTNVYAYYGYK
jgi:hypothetical protein